MAHYLEVLSNRRWLGFENRPKDFALGVEALKMPAQKVLVVGDSIDKDIVPAHSLGCITAWFKGEQWEEKALDESVAHLIISDLDELLS